MQNARFSVKERAGNFFRSLLISRWFSEKNPAGRSTFSAIIANRLPDFIRTSPPREFPSESRFHVFRYAKNAPRSVSRRVEVTLDKAFCILSIAYCDVLVKWFFKKCRKIFAHIDIRRIECYNKYSIIVENKLRQLF